MVSTISHSSHPDHRLIRTRLQRSVTCSICGKGGVTSCYHCKPCKFSIHVRCAGVSRGGDPRLKGARVEMPGCERPGQFGKPEKTSIEEVEVPGGRGSGSSRWSEERRPKSSRGGGANVGMPKLGHSGRIGVQGTMGAGAMGVSGQGVPTTKARVVGAWVLSGAEILSQVATTAVTGAGRGLVTKAITSMMGSGKSTAEGSSGIGGPGMDETDEKGEEEEGDDDEEEEEEVEDNDYDGCDDEEEEEQSLEVVKEHEIGAGIEEEDEEEDEEVEEEEEGEKEKNEEDDVMAIDSETEDIVPAKGFFAGMADMAARAVTSAVLGEDVDI